MLRRHFCNFSILILLVVTRSVWSQISDSDQFSSALSKAILEYNLTDDYFDNYVDYVINFNKSDDYLFPTVNYSEIATRYQLYIESDTYINSLNDEMRLYMTDDTINPNLTLLLYSLNYSAKTTFYSHSIFSDLTRYERQLNFGLVEPTDSGPDPSKYDWEYSTYLRTTSIDLREYAPSVRQQYCEDCWAVASTDEFYINYNIYHEKTQDLSKFWNRFSYQYALDCSGAGTCSGGYTPLATFFFQESGTCTVEDYERYAGGQDPDQCFEDVNDPDTFRCDEEDRIKVKTVKRLIETVTTDDLDDSTFRRACGFVSSGVAMQFGYDTYRPYEWLTPEYPYWFGFNCSNTTEKSEIRHVSVIVGFKKTNISQVFVNIGENGYVRELSSQYYVLVRNSWGSTWADGGYAWIHESALDACAMDHFIWTVPDPAQVARPMMFVTYVMSVFCAVYAWVGFGV